jgi:uncharacterized protein (TIGR00255 family)
MTGFGRAVLELPNRKVSIEIRALNSKQLDLNLKLPMIYREKESDIRTHLSSQLERGKVDCYINVESNGSTQPALNEKLALEYAEMLKNLARKMGQTQEPDYLSLVMRMPEVMNAETDGLEEEEWIALEKAILAATLELDMFRDQEGKLLSKELGERVDKIIMLLESVNPLEARRMELKREKLQKWVDEFSDKAVFDQNRFEQEMIFYLEKMDFTEEKVRLKQHCEYFKTTMQEKEGNGRKLNFITQEMGREINTLGAKANDADIQKIVVQMKDELEKVKEQLANVL